MPGSVHTAAARRGLLALILAALVAGLLAACGGGSSKKDSDVPPVTHRDGPETIFTAGTALTANPVGTLQELRDLGVDRVRVFLSWGAIAPDSTSTRRPTFDAADPNAYPAANWVLPDGIIRTAVHFGLKLDVLIGGPPPLWAAGPGRPKATNGDKHPYWKPNAGEFEQFVRAVGTRYSGRFHPKGVSYTPPRVGFWSIWNEPNIGANLGPATPRPYSKIEVSPRLYRGLLGAAWTGLHASGHGGDAVLIGELGPAGGTFGGAPGVFGAMPPLRFLRALYCVGSDLKPLSGTQAAQRGCPTTAGASARFAAANPGLFKATGFADHPYSFTSLPPDTKVPHTPDYTNLANIPALEQTLDGIQSAYGSHRKYPIWSTEYGYITNPPNNQYKVTPTLAAKYINWAEYISWRNPRISSYDQYLLADSAGQGFASGLETAKGVRKPTYGAFRMPVWLPVTSAGKGKPLLVWGCARPAKYVPRSKRHPVLVQFRSRGGGAWRTVARISTRTGGSDPYFDVHETFPATGSVRLSWSPERGPALHSRVTSITVK